MSRAASLRRGFTLIELLVVTAIAGILAAIAYPSFAGPVLKARRTDGLATLMQLQLSQERWRANNSSYATLAELRLPVASPMGYYRVEVVSASATSFRARATATGLQASDADCRVMQVRMEDGNLHHASGPDADVTNSSAVNKRCWNL